MQIGLGAAIVLVTGSTVDLEPDIFFLLFLPPLLFLDGWRIPKEDLVRDRAFILELALGLVVFTVLGVGLLIWWMIPAMPLGVAFALAAILSPTDPIAVAAIAKRAPIPKRLMHVLEGESLLNDASGLVCMKFAVAAVLTGTFSLASAAGTFLWLAVAGVAVGVGVTLAINAAKAFVSRRWRSRASAARPCGIPWPSPPMASSSSCWASRCRPLFPARPGWPAPPGGARSGGWPSMWW